MPTLLLARRNPAITELMDDPGCDPERLDRTYAHFRILNPLIAGWNRIYRHRLRPRLLEGPATLVDIGCGGGDVAAHLFRLALRDGLDLTVTGIDPDQRAIAYARAHSGAEFLACDSSALVDLGRRFDFVVSNHVLHHLGPDELTGLFRDSEVLARCAVVHNDIRRDDLGFAAFWTLAGVFAGSFIRTDGLRSIRRAYTPDELGRVLPEGWHAESLPPYRLLAVLDPKAGHAAVPSGPDSDSAPRLQA